MHNARTSHKCQPLNMELELLTLVALSRVINSTSFTMGDTIKAAESIPPTLICSGLANELNDGTPGKLARLMAHRISRKAADGPTLKCSCDAVEMIAGIPGKLRRLLSECISKSSRVPGYPADACDFPSHCLLDMWSAPCNALVRALERGGERTFVARCLTVVAIKARKLGALDGFNQEDLLYSGKTKNETFDIDPETIG